MRTVRKNTIQIALDIPEHKYGYGPTSEGRSVAEILVHIVLLSKFDHVLHEEGHLSSLEGSDFGTFINKSEIEERRPRSKSEIVDLLGRAGESWAQWVEKLPEALSEQVRMPGGSSKSRFEMLLGTKEHEMHHRAQLTVIERLLGVVPHLTRRRQVAREKAASFSLC
jgi:uncharacterized damage-inducible protein DinB